MSGLLLSGRSAFSVPNLSSDPHLFLMLRTSGGMDATLGLDPQVRSPDATESDLFLEYRPEDIISIADLKLGPTAKPLVPFAKKCAVLNGLMMRRDAGHDSLIQYMATGKGDGSAAYLPVELAASFGAGPYGVFFTEPIYTGSRNVILTTPQDIFNEGEGPRLSQMLKPLDPNKEKTSLLALALRNVISGEITAEKLIKTLAEVKKVHPNLSMEIQALLSAFISGASQQGLLDIALEGNLDTHADHEKVHFDLQTQVWQKVADIFSLFEKTPFHNGSLMDYTTFMVISEFSRTPFLNGAKGKDHNTDTNSVLLAGKGIQGGKTVGSSRVITAKKSNTGTPLHIATAVDITTGLPAENPKNASFIFPENVIRTVSEIFGNPKGFSAVDSNIAIIRGLIK